MAKPNYAFEKRQRELAKKKKKEEKALRKTQPRPADGEAAPDEDEAGTPDAGVTPTGAPDAPDQAPR
jgi:hypothetical protein